MADRIRCEARDCYNAATHAFIVVHHTPAQPTFDPTYRPQVRKAFERVKDDGRAEAALLAWWWWKHEAGR